MKASVHLLTNAMVNDCSINPHLNSMFILEQRRIRGK
jgi:hypothetical protein